jgi:hypothetical protein
MTKYVFSKGRIQVLDGIILKPERRRHPLRTATMFIVCNSEIVAGLRAGQQLTGEIRQNELADCAQHKIHNRDEHS